jgi:protocatechuate 3,4-dioxygenase beta subunit
VAQQRLERMANMISKLSSPFNTKVFQMMKAHGVLPIYIHMRISSNSQQDLITQIYFKGDKYIPTDPNSKAPQAANRILEISKNVSNESIVTFDIVMSKEFPLDKAAYKRITGLYQFDNNTH